MPESPRMHQVESTWSPYDRLSEGGRSSLIRLWARLGFSKEFGSMLRSELDLLLLRMWCAISPKHHRRVRELASRRDLNVHLGCGNNLMTGWLNVDCYPPAPDPEAETLVMDVRWGFPLADASASVIYSEHFLEHFPFDLVRRSILPECCRMLRPGGTIRLGVPDGEFFARHYAEGDGGAPDALYDLHRRDRTRMMFLNDMARGAGHFYLYDFDILEQSFREAGFVDLRRARTGDSQVPEFRELDMREDWRSAMTIFIEGRRPAEDPCDAQR